MSWKTEPTTMNSGMRHSDYILDLCKEFDSYHFSGQLHPASKVLLTIYRTSHAWYIKRSSTKGVVCTLCAHTVDSSTKRLHDQIIGIVGKTARPVKNHQEAANIALELDTIMNVIHGELKKARLINVESKYTEMGEHVATGQ